MTELHLLNDEEKRLVPDYMLQFIDYRKSGLSLNHVIGCPLNCGYCVRHFWGNWDMKTPQLVCTDAEAIAALLSHKFFIPHVTPIQLFNKATDPFLPNVKPHTLYVLKELDRRGLTNIVLVITRANVTEDDVAALEDLKHLRFSLFFTYSGIRDLRIEPVAASGMTVRSIQTASGFRRNATKLILYWRPIVPGWNDDDDTINHVLEVGSLVDAIVFTGYYHRQENHDYLRSIGVEVPYSNQEFQRRKILPGSLDSKVVSAHRKSGVRTPLFRKTSCGASYVQGLPDYNGHWGVPELCDICPSNQRSICSKAHKPPSTSEFVMALEKLECDTTLLFDNGHVWTEGLGEERRYFLQHFFAYQVWDVDWPHFKHRHGRGSIGYDQSHEEWREYTKLREASYRHEALYEDD